MSRAPDLPDAPVRVLLIEADDRTLRSHTEILMLAGYEVVPTPGLPPADELSGADVIVADVVFMPILQTRRLDAELIVITDDAKAGVTACLCGAADWIPLNSSGVYLTEAVRTAVTPPRFGAGFRDSPA